ncbi:hypothetical protein [Geodermatophilus marinus]|uniref:hypothetical protein n=1 Tax=Geodermatophilus sp. LHW52908 TaxID=2303986 RepID=UPI0011C19620|nr:hypothetical protein [Geodermatophilus sp. LHW52908]
MVLVLAATLGALGLVQWAGHGRAPFGDVVFERVEAAAAAAGLQVCRVVDEPGGLAGGAVASRVYDLAVRCPAEGATVVVDRFATAADRDAAARRFESLLRPRGSGAVRTLGDGTVLVRGEGDDDVHRALARALDAAGAR